MNFISQLKDVSAFIFNKDLSEGASGNISFLAKTDSKKALVRVKLPVTLKAAVGKTFAVTSTGSRIYELAENPSYFLSLVRVSKDGDFLEILNEIKPSSEILCHILSYEACFSKNTECRCIIHVHPKYSLALSGSKDKKSLNSVLNKTHTEFRYYFPDGIGFVRRTEPGTLLLAEKNAGEISKHSVVLWKNHGLIARGINLYECYDRLDTIESISKIGLLSG